MKEAELRTALDEAGLIAREYRARMHHARLDADGDGYVGLDELLRHELFASYSQAVVERVHAFFPYADRARHGELDEDDFVKLTLWTEDRTTRDSQRFWFGVVDVDGDGAVTVADVRELMRHFDDEAETDLWRRVDAKTFEAAAETLQAQTRGKARRQKKSQNAVSRAKRGEEIQARYRPEDE